MHCDKFLEDYVNPEQMIFFYYISFLHSTKIKRFNARFKQEKTWLKLRHEYKCFARSSNNHWLLNLAIYTVYMVSCTSQINTCLKNSDEKLKTLSSLAYNANFITHLWKKLHWNNSNNYEFQECKLVDSSVSQVQNWKSKQRLWILLVEFKDLASYLHGEI